MNGWQLLTTFCWSLVGFLLLLGVMLYGLLYWFVVPEGDDEKELPYE